jgi:LuxR family maltose regulon positive regulatory protein
MIPSSSVASGVVARRRLFDPLAATRRVTIVSAPAGSGKTFLLRSWITDAGLDQSAAWVNFEHDEEDPKRFWLAVMGGLRGTSAGSGVFEAITPKPGLNAEAIVERLLANVMTIEAPLWLVIDDLHKLRSSEGLRQLKLLLMRSPTELRFVIATRHDLRLGLPRLRLGGEVTEIRAEDLRFSLEEASALFEAAGVPVEESTLELLHARTEGWAAGLRMAALSLATHPDQEAFAAKFSGSERSVAEYLLDEVLDQLPDELRSLLIRTSVLSRVSGELADRMIGGSGGHRMLAELEQAGAFVVALDPQRDWFRYHRLFADLLALELRRTAADELPSLHSAAAEWLAEHNYPLEAIRHAQLAEDWGLAVRLLADSWFGILLDGDWASARQLLSAFPARMVEQNAELAQIAASNELIGGSLHEAERYLALAERESGSVPEDRRGLFEIALIETRLALARARNDVTAVTEEAERLLSTDPELMPPGLAEDTRAMTLLNLGIAGIWTGRRDEAERYLEQALALARRIERPYVELGAQAHLATVALAPSPLAFPRSASVAEERGLRAVELARSHGWSKETYAGVAFAALATVTLWRGRLSEAESWIELAESALGADADPAHGVILHTNRALLERGRGRDADAMTAFHAAEHAETLLATHTLAPYVRAHSLVARVANGEIARVQETLAQMDRETLDSVQIRVARAALHLAQGNPEDASTALEPIIEELPTTFDSRWAIQALLLDALALDALPDPVGASRVVERALDLAELSGVLLPFLFFPAANLLERHVRLHRAHASLVSDIRDLLSGRMPSAQPGQAKLLREPLSESELRVLRYLPTNLPVPEIASELSVSANTIRTHTRHMYAKLGVHTRAEAVDRARDLSLLAPSPRGR